MEYIIITPAYNEAKFIHRTIDSIINQILKPKLWVIVDDGSEDKTAEIIIDYSKQYPWIKLVQNHKKEERASGSKVVRAFYLGFETVKEESCDFIVKLDADLELPQNYFEEIARQFKENPKTGICGGHCLIEEDGKWIREKVADYHVRGAFKAYRKNCYSDIGGLLPVMGWDGLDELLAMFNNWEVKILPLDVYHFRKTGKASNTKKLYSNMGNAYYKMGFGSVSAIGRMMAIAFREKNFMGGIYFKMAYFAALFRNVEKHVTKEEQKFIRQFQRKRIISKIFKS
jgi:glycosyltransferase involved in cell wall biosynthesis